MNDVKGARVGYDLFKVEETVLDESDVLVEKLRSLDPVLADEVAGLAAGYGKLLKTTKKLVRISDRNEDKLNTLSKELARKNEQLEAQARELIKAAELREDVDRITRHDLKNPLQNILGVPELLLMTLDLEDYQRDMLKRVEQSGYDMLNMINMSLDLFKMEQGTYTVLAVDVDLLKVIRKILADQEPIWSAKEVAVSVTLDGEPPREDSAMFVQGEELLCYSMFSNLIRNALDASPEGKPLTVALDSGAGSVAIHNAGAVPEEIRDRFFDKYVTAGKDHGTGLGTYSARLIAEVHGGSVGFTTSESEGTEVTVALPTSA